MTSLGQTILAGVLPQIRTINIVTINGACMQVKANSFFPWKMVVSDDVVAYMCCIDIAGTVTTNAKNSVEISKNEYDRLVEKFKVYQECSTCMIEGFQDYSEIPTPQEEPKEATPKGETSDGVTVKEVDNTVLQVDHDGSGVPGVTFLSTPTGPIAPRGKKWKKSYGSKVG